MRHFFSASAAASPLLAAAALLLAPGLTLAQAPGVGIGTTTPNAAAVLDVSSSTQGLLPPRLSTAQRDALTTAQALGATQAGLLIFNTTTQALNQWNGATWTAPLLGDAGGGSSGTTFAFTGSPQTYMVPAGVTRLRVTAQGGSGGNYNGQTPFGLAALVTATVPVTPGETLTIVVGGQGGRNAATNPGGYNGGGQGGGNAGGGGGATDLRRATPATPDYLPARNALLVAGGSGGTDNSGALGGSGGTPTGADGANNAGSGASQTAPGGGSYAGANAQGGSSAVWGGGGGGYYGGGGAFSTGIFSGAGGGGSGYAGAAASSVVFASGTQAGNGYVRLQPVLPAGSGPVLDGSNLANLPNPSGWTRTGTNVAPTVLTDNVGIGTAAPTSTLVVEGSEALAYTTATTATFALTGAHRTVRRVGSCATITVPTASTCAGRLYTIINANGQGAFTLTVTGGGTVYDDISNTTFSGTNAFPAATRLSFQSDGTGWIVVGR